MFIRNSLRFNIYASKTIDGVTYPHFQNADLRAQVGITEIPDPVRESTETHYVREIDEAPYVINEPKAQDVLDREFNVIIKQKIAAIEAGQARAVREAALGNTQHLQDIETAVVLLRGQLKPEPVPAE